MSPDAQDHSWFDHNELPPDEIKQQMPNETTEYEQLMKNKYDLEEQSRSLDEEQKQLEDHAKMLCEQIIQEIKKRNSEKQQTVLSLREEIERMETQLRLASSLCEMSQRNFEKQQESNQLRETIGTLETQFSELGFSPISCEVETGKVENTPTAILSVTSQNEITEYNRNQQALAIVEQSK